MAHESPTELCLKRHQSKLRHKASFLFSHSKALVTRTSKGRHPQKKSFTNKSFLNLRHGGHVIGQNKKAVA